MPDTFETLTLAVDGSGKPTGAAGRKRDFMARSAIARIIVGVLLLTVALLILTWLVGGFEGLSGHGIGALIFGTLISLAVGVGLMAVIFASSRSGHDQAVHDAAKAHFPDVPSDDSVGDKR